MASPTPSVSTLLENIAAAGAALANNEAGSRENLIEYSRALVASLEIPSEFIQRSFWAEPAMSATIRLAVNVHLFQHLHSAGSSGLSASALASATGVDIALLSRLARHLVAMHILTYHSSAFHSTPLSDALAEENYQHSIAFCYDTARPSFNGFPSFFQKTGYASPALGGHGPFQDAHATELPFFPWLMATPPQMQWFGSFMSTYRAGKANWWDEGFYPVKERLIDGFEAAENEVLLVDVGGGRGHDMAAFAAVHAEHPGKILLQDQEGVIAEVLAAGGSNETRGFEAQACDFFTPQPIVGARAYSLHSILHDWSDEDGGRILANLAPALKRGYSRVLFNEIVVSEEKPNLAATSMDMMMLAHFAVRERTEMEWRALLEKAGLKVMNIYTYPGVAESLIEAELA